MQNHYIPYLQVRHDSLLFYEVPAIRHPRNYSTKFIQSTKYSGQMKAGTQKRVLKAVDILLQISPEHIIYNPVTGKHQPFSINLVTLTISCKRIVGLNEGHGKLLKPYLRILRKKYPTISYIWKAEYQERGQLHYHITTNRFIHYLEIRDTWNRLQRKNRYLDDYAKKHRHFNANSTDVHAVWKVKNLGAYLAKYLAKTEDEKMRKGEKGKVWDCSNDLKKDRFSVIAYSDYFFNLENEVVKKKAQKVGLERCTIFKLHDPEKMLIGQDFLDYQNWKR